jgi:hypothetical protein
VPAKKPVAAPARHGAPVQKKKQFSEYTRASWPNSRRFFFFFFYK